MDINDRIHKFKMNGLNIVLDINSGSVHVFDDLSYDIADDAFFMDKNQIVEKYKSKYEPSKILESYDEIKSIQTDGQLYTDSDYLNDISQNFDDYVIKALCLNVAHDCNLSCRYCFAQGGDFGGKRELMSFETGQKALDFLITSSGKRHNLEVDFFGGEPLMNFETVKKLVLYGDERASKSGKHFRWTITTNGVLLNDEITDFINKHMDNVVLSLDGRKEINDLNRPTLNSKGSYELTVPKFKKLVENRDKNKDYYIRGTFTRDNEDFSKDVLHFRELGFDSCSIEPVVDANYNPYAIVPDDLPSIFEEYEELAAKLAELRDFSMFHFEVDLTGGPCVIKRIRGCGAGSEYLAVTPSGDIYPCHQFVGEKKFLMGNINYETLSLPKDIINFFKSANIFTKKACAKCWARYYCSGGCHSNAIKFNGDINTPYEIGCEMQKKRLECAIMIKALRALEDAENMEKASNE